MSILVLGDGNFSFSMALARQLKGDAHALVSTSFDDSAAIKRKYPEAEGFLQRIHTAGGRTAHAVNAVQLTFSAESGVPDQKPFQHVIFHHPHLGVENMHRHRALLGHFFHSAVQQRVLAPRGVIHVSVGGRQAEDWQLREQATRHGLALLLQTPFPTKELREMGYEKKRHQAGRAFETAALCSTNYSFGRATDFNCDNDRNLVGQEVSAGGISLLPRENPPWLWNAALDLSNSCTRSGQSQSATITPLGVGQQSKHANSTAPEKPAAQEETESSCHVATLARHKEAVQWFKCSHCDRVFKCKRGLKSHEHMVHTLAAVTPSTRPRFRCSACSESFTHRRAAQQHMQSSVACPGASLLYLRAADNKNADQTAESCPENSKNTSAVVTPVQSTAIQSGKADSHALGAAAGTFETESQSHITSPAENDRSVHPGYGVEGQDDRKAHGCDTTCTVKHEDEWVSSDKETSLNEYNHRVYGADTDHNDLCHSSGQTGTDAEGNPLNNVKVTAAHGAIVPAESLRVCDIQKYCLDGQEELGTRGSRELQAHAVTCEICGLQFASRIEEAEHWKWLVPKEETWRCQNCSKCFVNERALRQHSAVCSVMAGAC